MSLTPMITGQEGIETVRQSMHQETANVSHPPGSSARAVGQRETTNQLLLSGTTGCDHGVPWDMTLVSTTFSGG